MTTEQCISCGHDDRPLVPIEHAFLPNDYKLCTVCYAKFHGKSGVGREADRIMTEVKIEPNYKCMKCGEQLIIKGNDVPMYCETCACEIYKTYKEFCQ